jgi:hypothetical protein
MKLLITIFVFTFTFSVANAQELIRNGSFENSDHLEFWNANVSVTGASVAPVNTEAHSGSWSVEIKSGIFPLGDWTQLLHDLLSPSVNTDYKLTFWIKGFVTSNNFVGVYGMSAGGDVGLEQDNLNNTSITDPDSGRINITQEFFQDWTQITYYFNSGQNFNGYLLIFEVAATGNSLTVYLDDFSIVPASQTDVEFDANRVVSNFKLYQNYPNPFNPSTKIGFAIPNSEQVNISVFNQLGEKVSTVLNSKLSAGYHEVNFNAESLPSGLYFYKISAGQFVQTKKMLLLK